MKSNLLRATLCVLVLGLLFPASAFAQRGGGGGGQRGGGRGKLGDEGLEGEERVQKLIQRLNGRSRLLRAAAAGKLGRLGPEASSAVPHLVAHVKGDPDEAVQCAAAEALCHIDSGSKSVISVLAAAVRKDGELRGSAAFALAEIGPPAEKKAISPLVNALDAKDPRVRRQVVRAIGRIGVTKEKSKAKVVERLRALADDEDRSVRVAVALALIQFGVTDDSAIEILAQTVVRTGTAVLTRQEAAEALGSLGSVASAAVPELVVVVEEVFEETPGLPYEAEAKLQHRDMRIAAANALGAMGAAAGEAASGLKRARSGADPDLGNAIDDALSKIEG